MKGIEPIMTIFAVISTDKNEKSDKLNTLITDKYEIGNYFQLSDNSWLVFGADSIQPQGVFKNIFGDDDTSVSCLVVPFESYWGVQSKGVWEWLKNKGL